MNLTTYPL